MMQLRSAQNAWLVLITLTLIAMIGCGSGNSNSPSSSGNAESAASSNGGSGTEQAAAPRKFEPVQLGGGTAASGTQTAAAQSDAQTMQSVVDALQPMQVLLGKWRGTTNRKFDGFNAVDELDWVWDFKSDPKFPALVAISDKSPYFREARLTYLPASEEFRLTFTPEAGEPRVLLGKFVEDPQDEVTDAGTKPQRTYKLTLTQQSSADDELWEVTLNQRENNRYLLELSRRRGEGRFVRFDTVGTQRLGTSFALNDEDYGDKKCIISGGLGTMTVSYDGKSYPVCCSGCAAAFNDDPVKWLARLAEQEKMAKE